MSDPIDIYLLAADEAALDAELLRLGLLQSVTLRGGPVLLPVDAGVALDRVGQLCLVPPVMDLTQQPPVVVTPAEYAPGSRCNIRLTGEAAAVRALLVAGSPELTVLPPAEVPPAQIRWAGGSTPWDGLASLPVPVPPAPAPESLSATKARLRARLAARRWEVETGGIVVAGTPIATDLVAQTKIDGALSLASLTGEGASWSTPWKGADGVFRTVTQADLIGIALAVGRHVQACYTREAALAAQVNAAGVDDLASLAAQIEAFELPG